MSATIIGPQPGPQTDFLSADADIVIYGGAAGGGKTWSLLFEPCRHILPTPDYPLGVTGFTGVIFRRTSPQIRNEGGLWDESVELYQHFGADPREPILEWRFPRADLPNGGYIGGQTIRFASMQHESDKNDWQGSQIPFIGFDELTHFTEGQFFYMLSRNRSTCGVKPYIRATTNPDADSWVANLIAWWIDQEEESPTYGLPIKERAGKVRYFLRVGADMHWADTPDELLKMVVRPPGLEDDEFNPFDFVKSLTFIPASVYDNKKLLQKNPTYLGNLMSLPLVERERLLGMNWKVRASAGKVFNRDWFNGKILPNRPDKIKKRIRFWDKAASDAHENAGKSAYTVGLLLAEFDQGYLVEDIVRGQWTSYQRNKMMLQTAETDGYGVHIWVEQEPGSGGKESYQDSIRLLAGYVIRGERPSGDKIARAHGIAAQVEGGRVFLLQAPWNKAFIEECHNFPDQKLKDQVDAFSGAFNKIARRKPQEPKKWAAVHR